jgi:UDP-N-acetylglucosamine--N-acetylmuramyl-(pentapeptide) pyrophosphoryl-undecaprenol N-acetylglucosamine transferase
MRVVMTGGGTGGHLYPGLAIAEELMSREDCQLIFIGTRRGLESRIVPNLGLEFYAVWISGLHRKRFLKNLLFPIKMAVSLIQAIRIVRGFHPHVVIGTGGYVSWPVLMAAILLKRKTVIQEQNRTPGLVTRILAPWVDSIHVSFNQSIQFFNNQEKVHDSGNPTRKDLEAVSKGDAYQRFGLSSSKTTLFIFGGSQGSKIMNEALLKIANELVNSKNIQILWAAGPYWSDHLKKELASLESRIKIFPFISDMGSAYAISDLVICRAGATTVAEITRLGIAAVLIPLATAAAGHQEKNARLLAQSKAVALVLESELHTSRLSQIVLDLLNSPSMRKEMSQQIRKFGRPEAARFIVDDILHLTGCSN